jgi:hypothetical protein
MTKVAKCLSTMAEVTALVEKLLKADAAAKKAPAANLRRLRLKKLRRPRQQKQPKRPQF